ncbi:MAG: hypothetical protein KDA89_24195 [Planctomycetaceae bacterium]|nr:hypothetical protein [Planctomycetaceae bacterium]
MNLKEQRIRRNCPAVVLLLLIILPANSGCSLFVMAGKAVFGDPKMPSQFHAATGIDLTKTDDKVMIICDAPHQVLSQFPSLQIDLVNRVSRNLETHRIHVVPSGDVAGWFDDHGEWGDYSELGRAFDARYVIHMAMIDFQYRVPSSENLLHGNAEGQISVHEVMPATADRSRRDFRPVRLVFDRNFSVTFPGSYPVPRDNRSDDQFLQTFLDRIALQIGQHIYDYRTSESVH